MGTGTMCPARRWLNQERQMVARCPLTRHAAWERWAAHPTSTVVILHAEVLARQPV